MPSLIAVDQTQDTALLPSRIIMQPCVNVKFDLYFIAMQDIKFYFQVTKPQLVKYLQKVNKKGVQTLLKHLQFGTNICRNLSTICIYLKRTRYLTFLGYLCELAFLLAFLEICVKSFDATEDSERCIRQIKG